MTFLVPFDGSDLAEVAIVRAVEFATVLEESVIVVTVIPRGNASYAREHGWLAPEESFDLDRVIQNLESTVMDISPILEFEPITVDRWASSGVIARRLRQFTDQVDASLVFLGSENAGRLVTSLHSVGGSVASGSGYDVFLVRQRRPLAIESVEAVSPFTEDKPDVYEDTET